MRALALSIAALIALLAFDFVVIILCFMYRPDRSATIMMISMVLGFLVAASLRKPWLFFIVQNAVSVLFIVRISGSDDPLRASDFGLVIFTVLVGNILVALAAPLIERQSAAPKSQAEH